MIHVVLRTAATEPVMRAVTEILLPSMETSPLSCANNIAIESKLHVCYQKQSKEEAAMKPISRVLCTAHNSTAAS